MNTTTALNVTALHVNIHDLTPAQVRVLRDYRDGTRDAAYDEWTDERPVLEKLGLIVYATGARPSGITDAGIRALRALEPIVQSADELRVLADAVTQYIENSDDDDEPCPTAERLQERLASILASLADKT